MGNSKFKIGDVVRLKSGGPDMVISKMFDSGVTLRCAWFAGKKHEEANFDVNTIIPVPEVKDSSEK